MDNSKNLTFDGLCKYLHVGRNTGYKLLASGQIKACKVGKKWVIQKREIDKFLDNHKKKNIL